MRRRLLCGGAAQPVRVVLLSLHSQADSKLLLRLRGRGASQPASFCNASQPVGLQPVRFARCSSAGRLKKRDKTHDSSDSSVSFVLQQESYMNLKLNASRYALSHRC